MARADNFGESCDEVVSNFFGSTRHACEGGPYGAGVIALDAAGIRELLEAAIAGFSVLGGGMACISGFFAERALARGQAPAVMAHQVNEGIALGFRLFSLPAIAAVVIMGLA
ncbi:MAG TPA: hypothetical protein VF729_08520 [Solirubrobacterales bacterium]